MQLTLEPIQPPLCSGFAARSLRLQALLMAAGYRKRNGVSTAGIRLVSRVARQHRLRDWPNTRSWADYEALIDAVAAAIAVLQSAGDANHDR